jgi:hypothetical protein
MFKQQMRALEQQQAQETEPSHRQQWKWSPAYGYLCAHLAPLVSTLSFLVPPRYLHSAPITRMGLDTDILLRAVGSVADKPKSVTYTPAVRSPEIPLNIPHGNSGSGQVLRPAVRKGQTLAIRFSGA